MGKYDSKNQYNKIHYKQFNIRLNIDDDADTIAYLESLESLPDFLRRAVNNAKMAQKKAQSRAKKKAEQNAADCANGERKEENGK